MNIPERMKDGRTPLLPIEDLKAFLDKQHAQRDILFEEVASLIVESTSVNDDVNTVRRSSL